MLRWALIFLVIALIAAALGFTGVYAAAAGIALLRTKSGLGPLAQATEEDLVPPLRDLVEALLKNG